MSESGGIGPGRQGGVAGGDWASYATGKVEEVVSLVRDRTVTPVLRAVRIAIFSLLGLAVGGLLGVFLAVGAVRVLDNYLFHRRVWASYLVVGGIFAAVGLFLSRMTRSRPKP